MIEMELSRESEKIREILEKAIKENPHITIDENGKCKDDRNYYDEKRNIQVIQLIAEIRGKSLDQFEYVYICPICGMVETINTGSIVNNRYIDWMLCDLDQRAQYVGIRKNVEISIL